MKRYPQFPFVFRLRHQRSTSLFLPRLLAFATLSHLTTSSSLTSVPLALFDPILEFLSLYFRNGAPITIDGESLSIPAVAAVARHPELVSAAIDEALAALSKDDARIEKLAASRRIIDEKLAQNKSIYGVSTGFGGSG
jgi:hypothetical protein